jgi:hypothetical protein
MLNDRKLQACFKNKHCEVEYTQKTRGLDVEVRFPDGYKVRWRTITVYPSVETAKMAAEAAHRNRKD